MAGAEGGGGDTEAYNLFTASWTGVLNNYHVNIEATIDQLDFRNRLVQKKHILHTANTLSLCIIDSTMMFEYLKAR